MKRGGEFHPSALRLHHFEGRRRRPLDRSGAAEADCDFARLDDYGDIALVVRQRQHPREPFGVLQNVDVIERDIALRVRLTGVARVGSEILAEDENFFRHKKQNIESTRQNPEGGAGILNPIFRLLYSDAKLQGSTPYVT